jgi:hypothetical protein
MFSGVYGKSRVAAELIYLVPLFHAVIEIMPRLPQHEEQFA